MSEKAILVDISRDTCQLAVMRWTGEDRPAFMFNREYEAQSHARLDDMLDTYLEHYDAPTPKTLGIAIAGPITGDIVRSMHNHLHADINLLKEKFGFKRVILLNDVSAIASSIPWLDPADILQFSGPRLSGQFDTEHGRYGVLNSCKGLGCASLNANEGQLTIVDSEAGHATFAFTGKGAELLTSLRKRYGFISRETVLTFDGLVRIYNALCEVEGISSSTLAAHEIIMYGKTGADPLCQQTLDFYYDALASVAGDFALERCTTNGLFIAGGVVRRTMESLPREAFRKRFEDKGDFSEFTSAIPACIVHNRSAGLIGLARHVSEKLAQDAENRLKPLGPTILEEVSGHLDQSAFIINDRLEFVGVTSQNWYDTPGAETLTEKGAPLGPFLQAMESSLQLTDEETADTLAVKFSGNQEFEFTRRVFGSRILRCHAYPRPSGGFVVIETDRTLVHNRTRELETIALTLRQEKNNADAASRAKSEFLANMSHEIRTPLNGVLGMADVLRRSSLTPSQIETLDVIISSGNSLLTVINDILDFSKIEAGKMRIQQNNLDLQSCTDEVAAILAAEVDRKGLELMTRFRPDTPRWLLGDAGRLRQIMTNLLGNAVKFTEEGHILLDVSGGQIGDEADISITVTDTGCGIPDDKLETIFQTFEQVDGSSTRVHQGTGLGLSITRRMVELMGGTISVSSTLGAGSSFTVRLRLPLGVAEELCPSSIDDGLDGYRILIVDDQPVNRTILQEQLSAWGCEVISAAGASDAISALSREFEEGRKVDAAILDYQMPYMDGMTLAKELKAQKQYRDIPLTLLTSVGSVVDAPDLDQAGFVTHLVKPARAQSLWHALVKALGKVQPVTQTDNPDNQPGSEEMDRPVMRVLVAEDNAVNRMVITAMLENGGYEITMTEGGEEAVSAFSEMKPDIVLMDVQMPGIDGLEATKRIRSIEEQNGIEEHVPVIGITAHTMPEDRRRCLDSGMDDYLPKPIVRDKLLGVMERFRKQSA
ncbi:glucokinase [Parvularcula marina]|uniref:glucokinase n=1 Tax=Parvularcula marina TaxID=2292771 RepID=UPI0011C05E65|nr:glucokinase [Parvularcula marina]